MGPLRPCLPRSAAQEAETKSRIEEVLEDLSPVQVWPCVPQVDHEAVALPAYVPAAAEAAALLIPSVLSSSPCFCAGGAGAPVHVIRRPDGVPDERPALAVRA